MTWLAIKEFTKRAYLFIKEYWQVPFLVIWTLLIYVFSRRNTDALVEVLAAKKKSHAEQIKLLKKQHKDEIMERDRLISQYHETVSAIEQKYKEQKKILSSKEKSRIKQIIKDSKGEPEIVKAEIEKAFGFIC